MRAVFMGTPEFAVPFLEGLLASRHTLLSVVTQPDRPRGRGQRLQAPPVKQVALRHGLEVLQPSKARDPHFLAAMEERAPDAIVLVAYGQPIPSQLLALPAKGCINVHPSLLPRHRGASPIQAALLAGDRETGVTTMYMDEGLDTGDIILQKRIPIEQEDTAGTLHDKLATFGVPLLLETLEQVEAGIAPRLPQAEEEATYASKLDKADGFLRWERPAIELERIVRAFTPVPGGFTRFGARRVRIWAARANRVIPAGRHEKSAADRVAPGLVLQVDEQGVWVACGDGVLCLQEVQPENGRRMSGLDFANGYRLGPGAAFGSGSPTEEKTSEGPVQGRAVKGRS